LKSLSHLKIGQRLALAFGVILSLLLAMCCYSAYNANALAGDLKATANVDMALIAATAQLQQGAATVARASRELLIVDSAGQIKKQRASVVAALEEGQVHLRTVQGLDTGAGAAALVEAVKTTQADFAKAANKFLTTQEAGNPDDTRSALLIDLRPVQTKYEQALDALTQSVKKQAAARAAEGATTAKTAVIVLLGLGATGLAVGVAASWAITRSITLPLQQATQAAEQIKAGDLAHSVSSNARDEIGDLLRAMGGMQQHLLGVIENVLRSARDVATSSDELAHGNTELSTRTERNASSLQQTAAAMEQIASNVSGSSSKSREASAVATRARDAVVEGGAAVDKLVETMTRIAGSSARIKDIIAVIDGIAFQTNILALNAAVEAARAGEQGRGFAVVATEVRSLAARASGAAREIKGLIDDSAARVADGTATVSDVGQRIRGIVQEVMSVRQLIEAVSSASHEQESGMVAVNGSVGELDQSTQQNAALVEEIAATTESLKANAKRLVQTVEFFRLPGQNSGQDTGQNTQLSAT
jgi:methyl-accepting chemotaxis protein